MKITHIKLENFAGIYAGMNRTCVEIDFKNNKNKIIIFNAANGKGKTTLLSMMHPLRETFDSRKNIILPGELGHKSVTIEHDRNIYQIDHYYGKKNKSFISKNGKELNENGNITSFNEIVKEELGIDENYFKIGKIGSNVSNFIDFKTTDRKKYINTFIPSIDEYLQAYEVIKEKYTAYNSQIKYIKNTIDSYCGLQDLDEIKLHIKQLSDKEKEFQVKLVKVESKLTSFNVTKEKYENEIIEYINEHTDSHINNFDAVSSITIELDDNLTEIEHELDEQLKRQKDFLTKFKIRVDENILEYIQNLETKFNNRKIKLEENISSETETLKDLNKTLINSENKINYYTEKLNDVSDSYMSEEEVKEITDAIDITNNEIELAKNTLTLYVNKFENIDLNEILMYYNTHPFNNGKEFFDQYDIIKSEYDLKTLNNFYNLKKKNIHFASKANSLFKEIEEKEFNKDKNDKIIHEIEGRLEYVKETLPKRSSICNDDNCSFIKSALEIQTNDLPVYNQLIKENEAIDNSLKELKKELDEISLYKEIENKLKNIETVIMNSLPPYFVNKIFDRDILITNNTTLIDDLGLSDIEKILSIKKNIKELEEYKLRIETKLNNFKISETLINEYKTQISQYNEIKINSENEIAEKTEILEDYNIKLNDANNRITICNEYYKIDNDLTNANNKYEQLESLQKSLFVLIQKYNNFKKDNDIDELINNKDLFKRSLEEVKTKLDENNTAVKIIEDNMTNLNKLEKVFEDIVLIKDALDPKKGIPVVFANEYLKSISTKANELLKIAYDDQFKIRFNVTASDFLIEVYKGDGTVLSDISQASQGETSLTNVSLSLAMLESMIQKYNIIYLDEVDATLSTENRRLFIDLLETQINSLGIEQCFVISHNNEFYDKNVDLILLEGHDCDLNDADFMKGKNVLFKI